MNFYLKSGLKVDFIAC